LCTEARAYKFAQKRLFCTNSVQELPSTSDKSPRRPFFSYFTKSKDVKALSKYWSYQLPQTEIALLEKEMKFPVRIVGTRKADKTLFWTWDAFLSLFVRDKLHPYLFLTFEDKEGKRLGPVCYNSELIGWGLKIGAGLRIQVCSLSGSLQNIYFQEIPKQLNVQGFDLSFYVPGAAGGVQWTKLTFDGFPNVKLHYIGTSFLGADGYVKIKKGRFEAEPYICSIGLPPKLEMLAKIFLYFCFAFGLLAAIGPILYTLGYFDAMKEWLRTPPK